MNTQLLKSQMTLAKDTLASLAKALGRTSGTVWLKVNGKSEFTQSEIAVIAKRYELSPEQIEQIFFS